MAAAAPVLRARELTVYRDGVTVLDALSLMVHGGEVVAVMGPSGSGKTTLLAACCGLIDFGGDLSVHHEELRGSSTRFRRGLRRRRIGLVHQEHHLLDGLTLAQNISFAGRMRGMPSTDAERASASLADDVGISGAAARHPDEVSRGQAQRAAVARALIGSPAIVLADEPTGALDRGNADQVMDLIVTLVHTLQLAAIVVTHDPAIAARADRTMMLTDGRLASA